MTLKIETEIDRLAHEYAVTRDPCVAQELAHAREVLMAGEVLAESLCGLVGTYAALDYSALGLYGKHLPHALELTDYDFGTFRYSARVYYPEHTCPYRIRRHVRAFVGTVISEAMAEGSRVRAWHTMTYTPWGLMVEAWPDGAFALVIHRSDHAL